MLLAFCIFVYNYFGPLLQLQLLGVPKGQYAGSHLPLLRVNLTLLVLVL